MSDTVDVGSEAADRSVIRLGNLDPLSVPLAPIDPCTVIDRDHLPIDVRSVEHLVRTSAPPADDGVGCRLEYRSGPGEVALVITITWTATAPGPLDSTSYSGAVAVTFAGRPGVQRAATEPHGVTVCLGLMPAAGGTASARVRNIRYPVVHPCVITNAVLTAIAHKTP